MRRLLVLALVAAAALVAGAAFASVRTGSGLRASIAHRRCPSGLAAPWRCAVVGVPVDRAHPGRGRIGLAVALLHAPGPPRPAVVAIAGGPGQAAIPGATRFAQTLAPLLAGRDLLVVDERGTGVSDPARCPDVEAGALWSPAQVASCAQRLGGVAAHLGSADSADDLEAVRHELGIPRLVLYGVSYGTKTAADYARRHPARVAGIVLDSPIVEDTDPFYLRSARGAARVLGNLCAEGDCPAGADPVADLRALVARMTGGSLTAQGVTITEGAVLNAVVAGGAPLHALPAALHAAAAGDVRPLAAVLPAEVPDARGDDWLAASGSNTMYLATSCDDGDFPWASRDDAATREAKADAYLAQLPPSAFGAFDRFVGEQYGETRICASWPDAHAQRPPAALPDVPSLLLVGADDDVAPLEGARELAAELPRATVVVAPRTGHGVLHGAPAIAAAAMRTLAAQIR